MPEKFTILPAEYLNEDGSVNSHKVGTAWQKGEITAEQLNEAMETAIQRWLQALGMKGKL